MTQGSAWLARVAPTIELRRRLDPSSADFGPLQDPTLWADPTVAAKLTHDEIAAITHGASATAASCLWVLRQHPTLATACAVASAPGMTHLPETTELLLQVLDQTRDPVLLSWLMREPAAHPYADADATVPGGAAPLSAAERKAVENGLRVWLCTDPDALPVAAQVAATGRADLLAPLLTALAEAATDPQLVLTALEGADPARLAAAAGHAHRLRLTARTAHWWARHHALMATAALASAELLPVDGAAWVALASAPQLEPFLLAALRETGPSAPAGDDDAGPGAAHALACHPSAAVRAQALNAAVVRRHASVPQLAALLEEAATAGQLRPTLGVLLEERDDLDEAALRHLLPQVGEAARTRWLGRIRTPQLAAAYVAATAPAERAEALRVAVTKGAFPVGEPITETQWVLLRSALRVVQLVVDPTKSWMHRSPFGESVAAALHAELTAAWGARPAAWMAAPAVLDQGSVHTVDELAAVVAALTAPAAGAP